MTAKIIEHPFRKLAGRSFVPIVTARTIQIDDPIWERIVGLRVALPAGTELEVDPDRMEKLLEDSEEGMFHNPDIAAIPVIVRDPYFPAMQGYVRHRELKMYFNQIETGTGPRRVIERRRCTHQETPTPPPCDYCFWRWCMTKLQELKDD